MSSPFPLLTVFGGSSACGHRGPSGTAARGCPGAPHHTPSSLPQWAKGHPHARHPEIDRINICLGNSAPGPLWRTWSKVLHWECLCPCRPMDKKSIASSFQAPHPGLCCLIPALPQPWNFLTRTWQPLREKGLWWHYFLACWADVSNRKIINFQIMLQKEFQKFILRNLFGKGQNASFFLYVLLKNMPTCTLKISSTMDQRDSTVNSIFALPTTDLHLISSTK